MMKQFPVIDPVATGENIVRLRKDRGLTVRDLQNWFGFEEPQAIYKWQKGKSLPTVDNLYALGTLLDVPMEQILVSRQPQLNIVNGQQDFSCCPFQCDRNPRPCDHLCVRQRLRPDTDRRIRLRAIADGSYYSTYLS